MSRRPGGSERSWAWDRTTRRQIVAGGIVVIMGIAWLLISLLPGEAGQLPGPVGEPTRSPEPRTTVPQDTPTAEPGRPETLQVSLVSEWTEMGDVEDNEIDSISQGEQAVIGFRYRARVHDGSLRLTIRVEAARESRRRTIDRNLDTSGTVIRENAMRFETDEWTTGEKEATVVIRDEVTGFVSGPSTVVFDVT